MLDKHNNTTLYNTYCVDNYLISSDDKIKTKIIDIFGTKYEIKHYSNKVLNNKFFIGIGWLSSLIKRLLLFKQKNKTDIAYTIILLLSVVSYVYLLFYSSKMRVISECIEIGTKCEYIYDECIEQYYNYEKQHYDYYLSDDRLTKINLLDTLTECVYITNYNKINNIAKYKLLKIILMHFIFYFATNIVSMIFNHIIKFSIRKYKEYIPDFYDIV